MTPHLIEERNDRVLSAARSSKTAPKYQIFENDANPNEATAVLRATIEEPSPPKHVKMSVTRGEIDKEVEPTIVVLTKEEAYAAKMENIAKSMPQLSIYNESYNGGKGKSSAEVPIKNNKRKKNDHSSATISSKVSDVNEIDEAELLGKVDNNTRHMMLKTKFLFDDSKKFIKNITKKKKKKKDKDKMSNSSSLPHINTMNEYDNDYDNDGFDGDGLLPSVWGDENTNDRGPYNIDNNINHGFSRPATSTSSRPSSTGSQSRPNTSTSMLSPTIARSISPHVPLR